MTTAKDVLVKAREVIADPKHWTKGAGARNAEGRATYTAYEDACSFCLIGAVERARILLGEENVEIGYAALDQLRKFVPYGCIADYNDTHFHYDVLALLDRATA